MTSYIDFFKDVLILLDEELEPSHKSRIELLTNSEYGLLNDLVIWIYIDSKDAFQSIILKDYECSKPSELVVKIVIDLKNANLI